MSLLILNKYMYGGARPQESINTPERLHVICELIDFRFLLRILLRDLITIFIGILIRIQVTIVPLNAYGDLSWSSGGPPGLGRLSRITRFAQLNGQYLRLNLERRRGSLPAVSIFLR